MNEENKNKPIEIVPSGAEAPVPPSRMEEFAKTSKAAKLSGTFHKNVGSVKKKFGEITNNPELQKAGENQVLLGKVHTVVGIWRGIKTETQQKLEVKKQEGKEILIKHGVKLLDVVHDFAQDVKKFFK